MLIYLRSKLPIEYVLELEGNETILDIRKILEKDYEISNQCFVVNYKTNLNISDDTQINELGIKDGATINLDFSEEALHAQKLKLERERKLAEKSKLYDSDYTYSTTTNSQQNNQKVNKADASEAVAPSYSSVPSKWVQKLSQRDSQAINRLCQKYGILQIVYDVFVACEFNEKASNSILSQYIHPIA